MEFFWYDYETWGKSPLRDRIVQFGGVRTDEDLELIDGPIQFSCQPGLDSPIGPGAVNVHGVMPMEAYRDGLPESEFAARVHEELSKAGTCSVAYNGMKFDHEFTRVLFYRNLRDPYSWAWRNDNTYWDTLDVMRATFLLRPEALQNWPKKDSGAPSFKLEDLSDANLRNDQISTHHDAVSDSTHMWLLAKMVREGARDLWEHALTLRYNRNVEEILDEAEPVLYVTGKIHTDRHCSTLISPLGFEDMNKIYGFDLFFDPAPLLKPYGQWTPEDKKIAQESIRSMMYKKSPFVCSMGDIRKMLSPSLSFQDVLNRMQLNEDEIRVRHEKIREYFGRKSKNPLIQYIQSENVDIQAKYSSWDTDPDEAIYEGFFSSDDRHLMDTVLEQGYRFDWRTVKSNDQRIEPLIFRYIARNFPDILDEDGKKRWYAYCRDRLLKRKEKRWVTADQVFSYELRDSIEPWGNLNESQAQDLLKWQDRVREVLILEEPEE